MENRKKRFAILIIAAVIIVIAASLLFLFRDRLFKKDNFVVTTFNSDIVIKRTDANESLDMPYRYTKALMDNLFIFRQEIAGINIASVKYNMSDNYIDWHTPEGVLTDTDRGKGKQVIDEVKYFKGISTLSSIVADKEDCKITIYEGYSEDLLMHDYQNFAIIPSSMSKYFNKDLPADEKVLNIRNMRYGSMLHFTIIGEYKTEEEYDTLYVTYTGLSTLIRAGRTDILNHVDCLEIDVNEDKDLNKLMRFLSEYYADAQVLSQYTERNNIYNDPYQYMFVHSMGIEPIELKENVIYEKNIITISRMDGKEDLEMSHVYADAIIKGYNKYSQCITDLDISTGVKGINPADYPPGSEAFWNQPVYQLLLKYDTVYEAKLKETLGDFPCYHQAVTSINEILRMKKDCKVTYYLNYMNSDLIVPRQKDLLGKIKGYAIVPKPLHEATSDLPNFNNHIVEVYESRVYVGIGGVDPSQIDRSPHFRAQFKIIGYYETTDPYDTVFVTYVGCNEKYKSAAFKNEHIESITMKTKGDVEISPLINFLKLYFAPSENAAEYAGSTNELGLAYEYSFTMKEIAE